MKSEDKEGRVGRKNREGQEGALVLWAQWSNRTMDMFRGEEG